MAATLQLADIRTGKAEVIATDIGRSILPTPSFHISFVQRRPAPEGAPRPLLVRRLDPDASGEGRVTTLVAAPPGAREADLAWMPDGSLLMAHEGKLFRWRPQPGDWVAGPDLAAAGLKGVTRLAVSPAAGDRLALVADGR
jgi:hypothetical protein